MCRFNLVLIRDEIAESIMQKESFNKWYDDLLGSMACQKSYCNCDSFVGSLCDKKELGYSKAIEMCKKEKLEKLYQIRELMKSPGYVEEREKFKLNHMEWIKQMEVFTKHIAEFEIKHMEELQRNYSGEELNKNIEMLYQKLDDMRKEVEANAEYRSKQEAYYKFHQENEIMNSSQGYFLTQEEEKSAFNPGIPLSELLGYKRLESEKLEYDELEYEELEYEVMDTVKVEIESHVIDEVITREENNTYAKNSNEFMYYHQLFSILLEQIPSLMFATIWSEPNELKTIMTVDIKSLKIDDLAFLDYDEVICITE